MLENTLPWCLSKVHVQVSHCQAPPAELHGWGDWVVTGGISLTSSHTSDWMASMGLGVILTFHWSRGLCPVFLRQNTIVCGEEGEA